MRGPDRHTGYGRRKLVLYHMIIRSNYIIRDHMLTQHNQARLDQTMFYLGRLVTRLVTIIYTGPTGKREGVLVIIGS